MSYRVCRKFISSTFRVEDQLCKIFLEPCFEHQNGFWIWNVGFAVGKSRRQVNDWYWNRKNKRARTLKKRLVGRSGMKTLVGALDRLLVLRWNLAPGDGLVFNCMSGEPEKQFRACQRWQRMHPDCIIDAEKKEFWWYRPPYPNDEVWRHFEIIPLIPPDKKISLIGENYFSAFDIRNRRVSNVL